MFKQYFEYRDGELYYKDKTSPFSRIVIGDKAGHIGAGGYFRVQLFGKKYLVHRIIWEMFNGEIPKGLQIDHINGIRDDNRIDNLRLVTNGQNQLNARLKLSNKIGIKGVYKSSKNTWAVWCGKVRDYSDDFFNACCLRKSWESKNEYCRKY